MINIGRRYQAFTAANQSETHMHRQHCFVRPYFAKSLNMDAISSSR